MGPILHYCRKGEIGSCFLLWRRVERLLLLGQSKDIRELDALAHLNKKDTSEHCCRVDWDVSSKLVVTAFHIIFS